MIAEQIMSEDLRWMRDQLVRFTYRPGWELTLEWEGSLFSPAVLIVRYPAVDSRDPAREGRFESRRVFGSIPQRDPEIFAKVLQDCLFDTELHESREWLRRDGLLYEDPHQDPNRVHCSRCGASGGPRDASEQICPGCREVMR